MVFSIKQIIPLALVGFMLLIGWWFQIAVWDFVTVFVLALVGVEFAFWIGLILWLIGLAFLAVVTIWIVKRFAH